MKVIADAPVTLVQLGDLTSPMTILACAALIFIVVLQKLNLGWISRASIIIGILLLSIASWIKFTFIFLGIPTNPNSSFSGSTSIILSVLVWNEADLVPNFSREVAISLLKSIKSLMHKNSIFVSESHYLYDLIQYNQYDTIYHEHINFFNVKSMLELTKRVKLKLHNVEKKTIHGSSYLFVIKLKSTDFLKSIISSFWL